MSKATVVIGDFEADAEKVLGWLAKGVNKVAAVTPEASAALATILGTVGSAIAAAQPTTAGPVTVSIAGNVATDLKAVWPEVQAFLKTLGITV